VDDKINARAARDFPGLPLNEAIARVTAQTEAQFHADVAELGCLPPDEEPHATAHIEGMKALIERLVVRGFAYVAQDHVLFSVAAMQERRGTKLPAYGALARRSLDEMLAGARVDVAPYKRDAMDFVLWKPSKDGEPGWTSPAGIAPLGRPGWHIECSAMSMATLLAPFGGGLTCEDPSRNTFDIHGGGIDLVFPHHENEIAQSCCALDTSAMADIWMHNGFLMVEGEKMSKSLGNFITIHELLRTDRFGGRSWPGDVLRLAMLKTHYRKPIDWTVRGLEEAYREWIAFGHVVRAHLGTERPDPEALQLLADDLNFPGLIARLHELRRQAEGGDTASGQMLATTLRLLGFYQSMNLALSLTLPADLSAAPLGEQLAGVLTLSGDFALGDLATRIEGKRPDATALIGLLRKFVPDTILRDLKAAALDPDRALALDAERLAARKAKDFRRSDELRAELDRLGIAVKDGKDAAGEPVTTWELKS
jgi:cysteinyl-tRNA synthetase